VKTFFDHNLYLHKFYHCFRVVLVLPKPVGPKGPRVVMIRASQYDPNKYYVTELLALTLVLQQVSETSDKLLFNKP
jgi:hypothetical protein